MTTSDSPKAGQSVTACVVVIGDEILSGRTQDTNLAMIATYLGELGIEVAEARVVPDIEQRIIETINEVRAVHNYVFTTGGIGPTHDDITADAIAKAFGIGIDYHPDVMKLLGARYAPGEFTDARKRMARIPDGAVLIDNPVSLAPGFQVENVFVMAGIPMIAKAMIEGLGHRLVGGAPVQTRALAAFLAEGQIAEGLAETQALYPDIKIGSYPFLRGQQYGVNLVMRGTDRERLERVVEIVRQIVRALGQEPIEVADR